MRTTLMRPAKGFWGRSYDELKRLSGIALRSEGVKGPSGPYTLQSFAEPASVADCKLITDDEIGGFSTAAIEWESGPTLSPTHSPLLHNSTTTYSSSSSSPQTDGYVRFHGTISTRLPAGRPEVQRTGYAAWRTADRLPTMFGRSLWDVDSYGYLALRVRSDGRSYLINVQTDSMVAPTDLHQHRLFAQRPGQWETVVVPWSDFVRTNHGFVVEPQTELLRQRVRSVGLGLTDRVPGPFELCVARLWATNNPDEANDVGAEWKQDEKAAAAAAAVLTKARQADPGVSASIPFAQSPAAPESPLSGGDGSGLRNKQGRPVRWDAGKQEQQQQRQQQQ